MAEGFKGSGPVQADVTRFMNRTDYYKVNEYTILHACTHT